MAKDKSYKAFIRGKFKHSGPSLTLVQQLEHERKPILSTEDHLIQGEIKSTNKTQGYYKVFKNPNCSNRN